MRAEDQREGEDSRSVRLRKRERDKGIERKNKKIIRKESLNEVVKK